MPNCISSEMSMADEELHMHSQKTRDLNVASVLKSDVAVMLALNYETFVEMRKYMANTSLLYDRMNAMEKDNNLSE